MSWPRGELEEVRSAVGVYKTASLSFSALVTRRQNRIRGEVEREAKETNEQKDEHIVNKL